MLLTDHVSGQELPTMAQKQHDGEIAPEMIEAGIAVLGTYRPEYDGCGRTVSEIYRAMAEAGS